MADRWRSVFRARCSARCFSRGSGVGKTELAKVLSAALGTELIRLSCYEGLDVSHAVYEWNYQRQLLEIRRAEARGQAELAEEGDPLSDS